MTTSTVALSFPRRKTAPANVALIRPPVVMLESSLAPHGPTPPTGLAYIAAVLREAGHRITVVDAAGEAIEQYHRFETPAGWFRRVGLSPQQVVERIPSDVTVIGISLMFFHEWPQAREVANLARERFPNARIVLGGETATSFWRWIFEQTDAVDYVVQGEGEATALALVDRLAAGEPVDDLEGLVIRCPEAEPVNNGLPTRIRRLESIPRPAWDLFPLEAYWSHPYYGVNRGRSMPLLATRGCPYRCSFCSAPQMWTTRYVVRDPDDVADEIADYVDRYGVQNVNFVDLTPIMKRSWTLDFCDALDRRGLDITWQMPIGTRSEVLDEEVLRRLYETGCRNVVYAPESGSDHMIDVFDKRVDPLHVLDSVKTAKRIGLNTHVSLIIGHPDETWRDLRQTFGFMMRAARLGCDDAAAIIFCPYPGSADFDRLVAEGKLVIDEGSYYLGLGRSSSYARSFNERFSNRQLRAVQMAMMVCFYIATFVLNPRRIVSFLRAQITGKEDTYLDQVIRSRRAARRRPPADSMAAA
jgi:anaerobic magnesium-protoporphyrin IX monomethyl ester cyclase